MILQNDTENITDGTCYQRGSFKENGKKNKRMRYPKCLGNTTRKEDM